MSQSNYSKYSLWILPSNLRFRYQTKSSILVITYSKFQATIMLCLGNNMSEKVLNYCKHVYGIQRIPLLLDNLPDLDHLEQVLMKQQIWIDTLLMMLFHAISCSFMSPITLYITEWKTHWNLTFDRK